MLYNLLAAAGSNALCSHIPIKQAVADLLKARIHQNKWLRHHYSTIYNPLMGLRVGAMQYRLRPASLLLEGAASLGWELPFLGKKTQPWIVKKGVGANSCEGICGLQHTTASTTIPIRLIGQGTHDYSLYPVPQFLSMQTQKLPSPFTTYTPQNKSNRTKKVLGGNWGKEMGRITQCLGKNRAEQGCFQTLEMRCWVRPWHAQSPPASGSLSSSFICGSLLVLILKCLLLSFLPLPPLQSMTWAKAGF